MKKEKIDMHLLQKSDVKINTLWWQGFLGQYSKAFSGLKCFQQKLSLPSNSYPLKANLLVLIQCEGLILTNIISLFLTQGH